MAATHFPNSESVNTWFTNSFIQPPPLADPALLESAMLPEQLHQRKVSSICRGNHEIRVLFWRQ